MLIFFGVLAGILSAFAYLPYIVDTIRGRTQPQRASWLIWTILSCISFFSQVHEGASTSLWFAGTQAGATTTIFLLSLGFGAGHAVGRNDLWILVASAAGLGLWAVTDSAAYALMLSISISLLGGTATVSKSYRAPDSETLVTWVTSFVASILAILAVGELNWLFLAYPIYLVVLNAAIIAAICLGRLRKRADLAARLQAPWMNARMSL